MAPADSTDIKLKAMDAVLDWTKQVITIASATLALSATFVNDMLSGKVICAGWLQASWVLFLLSVACGIVVMGSVSSALNLGDPAKLDIYKPQIQWAAVVQAILFLVAMACFIAFVVANMPSSQ